jgi:hypothetical protein
VIRAAHYLHVPPWELAEQPVVWTYWANAVMDGESQAEAERMARMLGGRGQKK